MPSEKERKKAEEIYDTLYAKLGWTRERVNRRKEFIEAIASALASARQEGRKEGAERVAKHLEDSLVHAKGGQYCFDGCEDCIAFQAGSIVVLAARSEARRVGEEK